MDSITAFIFCIGVLKFTPCLGQDQGGGNGAYNYGGNYYGNTNNKNKGAQNNNYDYGGQGGNQYGSYGMGNSGNNNQYGSYYGYGNDSNYENYYDNGNDRNYDYYYGAGDYGNDSDFYDGFGNYSDYYENYYYGTSPPFDYSDYEFEEETPEPCGGQLVIPYAVISTPGFPQEGGPPSTYPPNTECIWTYDGPETSLVQYRIFAMNIEPGLSEANMSCEFDSITFRVEKTLQGTNIENKLCGFKVPDEEYLGRGSFYIHFQSDGAGEYRENRHPCIPEPCQMGSCEMSEDLVSYKCNCDPGYNGRTCEIDIQECVSDPCLNGASCDDISVPNKYSCICTHQYEGTHCEKRKILPCDPNPCENGATCRSTSNTTFACECRDYYFGTTCHIDNFPPCYEQPCKNGGTCNDILDKPTDQTAARRERPTNAREDRSERPTEKLQLQVYGGFDCQCTKKFKGKTCDIEVGCINPGIDEVPENERYMPMEIVHFSCADGFIMSGEENITCLENGTWTDSVPKCEVNATAEAMRFESEVRPWINLMAGLGAVLGLNALAFAGYMTYNMPWKNLDRVINISHAELKEASDIETDFTEEDESSATSSSSSEYSMKNFP